MSSDELARAEAVLAEARRQEWLTVKEFADLKRVHPETVKRWCRKQLIDAEQVGRSGHWRIKHRAA